MTMKNVDKLHHFSDFAKDFVGSRIHMKDVLNREIIVLGFKTRDTKFKEYDSGKYIILQIELDGEKRVLFTSSKVLLNQAESYRDKFPFITCIIKHKDFYTFA